MSDPDVRTRILHEATRLFAERGYGATSVREVVQAAGVTKPTLYYHFANKEALFLETVHLHLERLNGLVEEALASPGSVRARLERFVEHYVQGALDDVPAVRLLMTVQHPAEKGRPQVDVMTVHLHKVELLTGLIAEGIESGELRADLDPRAAVLAFIGMVNFYLVAQIHGVAMPPDHARRLLDIFFHGAARR